MPQFHLAGVAQLSRGSILVARAAAVLFAVACVVAPTASAANRPRAATGRAASRMPSAPIAIDPAAGISSVPWSAQHLGVLPTGTRATPGPVRPAAGPHESRAAHHRAERAWQKAQAERRRQLRSPRARRDRRLSRSRYRLLGASAAIAAVRAAAPEVAVDPVWHTPSLRRGERVLAYDSATSMRVSEPGTDVSTVVQSSWPVVAPSASGALAPVDMTLAQIAGGGWRPVNAPIGLTIGGNLGAGVHLGTQAVGMTIRPAGPAGDEGRAIGNKIFYANSDVDTDTIVDGTPTGVSIAWTLRSPASPETLDTTLTLPAGVSVHNGPSGLDFVRGNFVVGSVSAPVAFDAQGTSVPATFQVSGNTVSVKLAHRGADLDYPISVDPIYTYADHVTMAVLDDDPNGNSDPYNHNIGPLRAGWTQGVATGYGSNFSFLDNGTDFYILGRAGSTNGSAAWTQSAPRQAFYTRAEFQGLAHTSSSTCISAGLFNWGSSNPAGETGFGEYYQGTNHASAAGMFGNCGGLAKSWVVTCVSSTCDANAGTSGNSAAVQMQIYGTAPNLASVMFEGGYLYIRDRDDPTIDSIKGLNQSWTNASNMAVDTTVSDAGLGIGQNTSSLVEPLEVDLQDNSGISYLPSGNVPWCDGGVGSRCPASAQMSTNMFALPEGQYPVAFTARDIINHHWTVTKTLSIDRTAPRITLGEHLGDLVNATTGSSNSWSRAVGKPTRLSVLADDTVPGRIVSGSVSLSLTVSEDGHATPPPIQGAAVAAFKYGLTYILDPHDWSPGTVHFSLSSTDGAHNTSHRDFDVTIARGTMVSVLDGQKTARRIPLQAQDNAASPAGSVSFAYRKRSETQWTTIDASQLRNLDGSAVSSSSIPIGSQAQGSKSTRVVWDMAAALPGVTEPVFVRGQFGSGTGDVTNDVALGLDPSGASTDDADLDVGPGTVDAVTGDFSQSVDDVSVSSPRAGLTVRRAYNSRADLASTGGPFGPGWSLGLVGAANKTTFMSVENFSEIDADDDNDEYGMATVQTSDGANLSFYEHETDTGYYVDPGNDGLTLTRGTNPDGTTAGFTLKDAGSGETTTFVPSGKVGRYVATTVTQAGSASTITYNYSLIGNSSELHVTSIVAPTAPGISCSNLNSPGCRWLYIQWDATIDRIADVFLEAPGAAVPTIWLAHYTYESGPAHLLHSVMDPRYSLVTTYGYDANNRLTSISPPGENPWALSYAAAGTDAPNAGRLSQITRSTPDASGASGPATESVVYGVPVFGTGGPYDLSPDTVATWGQTEDVPVDATAVFGADDAPTADDKKATVHYFDPLGRQTNEARPNGEIDTTEHDAAGNVIRELTAANRRRALDAGGDTAAGADQLSTQRTYTEQFAGTGWRMVDELGPMHDTRLSDGSTVPARKHLQITYDEGSPDPNKTYNLPTTVKESAWVDAAHPVQDARTTTTEYGTNWDLKLPTAQVVDPGGLNIRTTTEYNARGLVTYQAQPRSSSETAASTRHTIYYTAGPNSEYSDCGNKPAWADLPCLTKPGALPPGLASPVSSVYEYDSYGDVTKRSDWVDGTLRRVVVDGWDGGRHTSHDVSTPTSNGDPRPTITYGYSSSTGRLLTTTAQGSPTRTVTRAYDAVGRVTSYTDADGGTTTTAYDHKGRVVSVSDPSGTRTYDYDATTGQVATINDSVIGTMSVGYDDDGAVSSEDFQQANVRLDLGVDQTGDAVDRMWTKKSPCVAACTLFHDHQVSSIHGQWVEESGTAGTQTSSYDAAGRLVRTTDPSNGTCVTKTYNYDVDGNRLSRNTYPAASGGGCSTATTPSTQTLTYDQADRLNNSTYSYDYLGRITTVPAADAGGSAALNVGYYVNDLAHTLTQNGTTTTLDLDPLDRVRQRTVGSGTPTVSHFGDDSDGPAWTTQGTTVTRNVDDASGDLLADAQVGGGTPKLEVTNLHGDVLAEVPNSSGSSLTPLFPGLDAFGMPTTSSGAHQGYGFLGAKQRNTTLSSGTIEMGARLYQPQIGRFLQPDPVYGGSLNVYDYANQDPSDREDPSGESVKKWVCTLSGCFWITVAGLPGSHLPKPPRSPGTGKPNPGIVLPPRKNPGDGSPGDGDEPGDEDEPGDDDRPAGGNHGNPTRHHRRPLPQISA